MWKTVYDDMNINKSICSELSFTLYSEAQDADRIYYVNFILAFMGVWDYDEVLHVDFIGL